METKAKKSFLDIVKRYYTIPVAIIGFLCVFCFKYLPPMAGLTPIAMNVFGIFLGAMIFWLFLAIDWTSILIMAALIMSPLFTYQEVLANSIGTWVISFLIFSSAMCYVLGEAGFFRRCAVWILTRKISQRSPWTFITMLSVSAVAIGSFIATSTAFVLLMPVIEEIFKELGYEKGEGAPTLIMMCMLSFTAFSVTTTPIGHVQSIVGMSLYSRYSGGLQIGFLQYSIAGLAVCLFLMVGMIILLRLFFKADFTKLENINTDFLLRDYQPMSKKEKIAVAVFVGTIFFWLAPDLFSGIAPGFASLIKSLGQPTPPMIGIVILCLIEVDGEPIMDVGDAFANGVSWPTMLLVAAASILGDAVTHPNVGVAEWLGGLIAPAVSGFPPIMCVFVIVALTELITAFSSDLFTVTLMINVCLPMVLSGQLPGVNAAALTFVISISCVVAICAPGTSPSAGVASGSGWLARGPMFGWGMGAAAIALIGLTFIAYPIAAWLM